MLNATTSEHATARDTARAEHSPSVTTADSAVGVDHATNRLLRVLCAQYGVRPTSAAATLRTASMLPAPPFAKIAGILPGSGHATHLSNFRSLRRFE
eukprot:scaffold3178_cov109-Isochrysis_galbana.AAC.9